MNADNPLLADAGSLHTYFDRTFDRPGVKILPGEYYVATEDVVLVTVLGSCVAACIRDPALAIGGINHFMLPDAGRDVDTTASGATRYGIHAMEMLINTMIRLGARRERLEAKVFGGGNVLKGFVQANVGERNAGFVRHYLKVEGIRVVAEDLLDIHPRRVAYFPATGRALVRKLKDAPDSQLIRSETDYRSRLTQTPVAGDIELFG